MRTTPRAEIDTFPRNAKVTSKRNHIPERIECPNLLSQAK
jgi:hypothetical protein